MKIESLTPEQENQLHKYAEHWYRVGVDTCHEDKEVAELAITDFYSEIKMKPPSFIWADSPLSANILIHLLGDSLRDSLNDSLSVSLSESLNDSLRESLSASLIDSLSESLSASLIDSLSESLIDSLSDSLRVSLRVSLRDSLDVSLSDILKNCKNIRYTHTSFLGQMDSFWICFFRFTEQFLGVK